MEEEQKDKLDILSDQEEQLRKQKETLFQKKESLEKDINKPHTTSEFENLLNELNSVAISLQELDQKYKEAITNNEFKTTVLQNNKQIDNQYQVIKEKLKVISVRVDEDSQNLENQNLMIHSPDLPDMLNKVHEIIQDSKMVHEKRRKETIKQMSKKDNLKESYGYQNNIGEDMEIHFLDKTVVKEAQLIAVGKYVIYFRKEDKVYSVFKNAVKYIKTDFKEQINEKGGEQ